MCDPVSIGALALGAAGSAINGMESSNTANAMVGARNRATQQELGRQKAYGTESRGVFDTAMGGFTPEAQTNRLASSQTTAANNFASNAPTDVGTITTSTAPRVVGNSENRRVADAFKAVGDRNAAHGKLTGYDQTFFDNNADLLNTGRRIDTVGDFAKVSSGVNRAEQDAAYRNAYKPNSGIGDLLQLAGSVGGYYGGKGGGLPFLNFGQPTKASTNFGISPSRVGGLY